MSIYRCQKPIGVFLKIICVAWSLMSCKDEVNVKLSSNPHLFSTFPKTEELLFKEIIEYKEGIPQRFFLIDSTLIINNFNKNIKYFFYNYHLNTGEFSKGYVAKGRGPNEAIGGFCSGIHNDTLWLFDATLKKVLFMTIADALHENNIDISIYPLDKNYYKIALIENLQVLVNGDWNSKFKIQKIDLRTNKNIYEFGEFIGEIVNVPMEGLKDAYQAFIYTKPSSEKMALAYRFTDVLEIYDLQNTDNYKMIQGPAGFDINLNFNTSRGYAYFAKDKDTRKAFIAGSVTSKYIYLAYSGQIREDEDWNNAKYIHIYDWDGNPIKQLKLDRYITSFVVSGDNKIIYAFDSHNGFIVESKLNLH